MCLMNNIEEDSFSTGGQCNIKEPFNVGGPWPAQPPPSKSNNSKSTSGKNQCKITMVWADWCGFSKKAKPEWDKLVAKYNNKEIDNCTVTFEDAEEKLNPDIIQKFKTTGFPTYYCEMNDKVEEFNSIKEDDMLEKIKKAITKMKGSGNNVETLKIGGQNAPKPNAPRPNAPKPNAPRPNAPRPNAPGPNANSLRKQANSPSNGPQRFNSTYDKIRPTVEGEILFSSCESEYGPIRLESVDYNLAGIGNTKQNILGYGDCTELEFAPVKFSTGGPQIPSMNSLMPTGAQLKAPGIDGVQGIIRPSSFGSLLGNGNRANGNKPNGNRANGNKQ